jgi:parallel beta helix pectate lyase-like protein
MRLFARTTRLSYFVISALLFPLSGRAANVTVDCSGGTPGAFTSLQAAINSLDLTGPHQITVVGNGTCNENVHIVNRQRLTIIAPNGQFITSPVGAAGDVMTISGSTGIALTLLGFRGGSRGVVINRNSEVAIDGTTIDTNANAGVRVDGNSTVSVDGLIQNNGGAGINVNDSAITIGGGARILNNGGNGVVLRRSRGRFLGNVIQGNFNGVNLVNGSSAEFDAPCKIQNNLFIGVQVADGSSARFFGDVAPDGTPVPNVISGNPFVGLNIPNGQVVMFDANQILNNGSGGPPFNAGVRVDDNASLVTVGSGDIQISHNTGPGIDATTGGNVDLTGTVVANNSGDGIRLQGNAQVAFFPPDTNIVNGNGGKPVNCDSTSVFFGDPSGVAPIACHISLAQDQPSQSHRRALMEDRREK